MRSANTHGGFFAARSSGWVTSRAETGLKMRWGVPEIFPVAASSKIESNHSHIEANQAIRIGEGLLVLFRVRLARLLRSVKNPLLPNSVGLILNFKMTA